MFKDGLEVINDRFTAYASRFKGGDMVNNRYILLNNIIDGIQLQCVESSSPELGQEKREIAALIRNLFSID